MDFSGARRIMTVLSRAVACAAAAILAGSAGEVMSADAVRDVPAVATMKAVSFSRFGDSSVLQFGDLPRPVASSGELLVRVRAAAVNPADWKSRAGMYGNGPLSAPLIPGFDVAGVVAGVGPGVTGYKGGEEIYAMLPLGRPGGYAQFAIVPAGAVAARPKSVDYAHAAAVPLAALTAWQALFDTAKLTAGQVVLVHGGAGGVGHFAVQFAKARNARVIATASSENLDFLRKLGADQVIDYRTTRFEQRVKDADVVLDTIGGDTLRRSYGVLRKEGYLVSIVDDVDRTVLAEHGIRGSHVVVRPDGSELAQIAALIDEHRVRPQVSKSLGLEAAAAAQDLSQTGRTRGKIVLIIP